MQEQRLAECFRPIVSTPSWGGRATRAEVSLEAIRDNVRAFAELAGNSRVVAVVKADAYGHGAEIVGQAAIEAGAAQLAVYTVSEGVRLRESGIAAPILVFGPFAPPEAGAIVNESLTPTVLSVEAGESIQAQAQGREIPYHLKIDSGLSRSGVSPEEALPLVRALDRLPALRREGLYTHFARADESDPAPTLAQLDTFQGVEAQLRSEGVPFPVLHVANSAGSLAFPQTHLHLIRQGISTYGYYPSTEVPRSVPLTPALSLLSTVVRVHHFPAGTGVGYGHEFRCERETTLALVPIGYGDGLPRSLGHARGAVLIRGARAPIVGRVSMDQVTVDVTDVPGVRVGDDVTVIGRQGDAMQTADDVGHAAGTISYDILTGLLPRVPRLYADGGRIVAVKDQGVLTRMPGRT
jgi:alanine racemase